ncbi:uncharacterized protein [Rutidosis leptorrhynchoides]|uniref:uncharacterized protein n=1 Tax=Rutidosis leptorrhynchoides TaxID=125765 RepID=UPI003A996DC1
MVSFNGSLLPTSTMIQDSEDYSKKRKIDESSRSKDIIDDLSLSKNKYLRRSVLDTELHLETPMPSEWQRCLDIKSGQIYYYNTRTQKKTSMDPRNTPEPPKNMSLELELNFSCGSSSSSSYTTTNKIHHVVDNFTKYKTLSTKSNKFSGGGAPSWLALEGEGDNKNDEQQEMMTAVCKKCHMLVMMFKTSPSCPNCKFMHPPNQTPTTLFNSTRELSLLC